MDKTTNVFTKILSSIILILITFMYMMTNSSVFVGLVSTVFFGVVAYREHYLATTFNALIVLLCIIAYNISNIYVDLLNVAIDFLYLCFTGIVAGIMLKNKQKHFNTIVAVSIADILKLLLSLLTIKREGLDIFETLIENPARMYSEYAAGILAQSGSYSDEVINVITDLMDSVIVSISTLMPAIIIIISIVTSYFSYVLIKKNIEIFTREKLYAQSFSHLKMNPKIGIVLLVFVILTMVIPQSIVADAILNIVVIFLFAYFVCGLSVIDFYFKKSRIWWWVRLIIYVMLIIILSMFISALPFIFVLLAMIDARKDIRGLEIPDIVIEIKDDDNES